MLKTKTISSILGEWTLEPLQLRNKAIKLPALQLENLAR